VYFTKRLFTALPSAVGGLSRSTQQRTPVIPGAGGQPGQQRWAELTHAWVHPTAEEWTKSPLTLRNGKKCHPYQTGSQLSAVSDFTG